MAAELDPQCFDAWHGLGMVLMRSGDLKAALGAALMAACSTLPIEASAQPAFKAEGKTLRQVYEYLHANPELSFQEVNSSAILAAEVKRLGFTVTTGLGDAWTKARAQKEYGKVQDGVGGPVGAGGPRLGVGGVRAGIVLEDGLARTLASLEVAAA